MKTAKAHNAQTTGQLDIPVHMNIPDFKTIFSELMLIQDERKFNYYLSNAHLESCLTLTPNDFVGHQRIVVDKHISISRESAEVIVNNIKLIARMLLH